MRHDCLLRTPSRHRRSTAVAAATICLAATLCLALGGCDRVDTKPKTTEAAAPAVTNRVEIGPVVRRNLGITFARAEPREVARTLRVPARVELPPSARREERAPTAGAVEVLVREFQTVRRGEPLYRLQSPHWRELQQQLARTETALSMAEIEVASLKPLMEAHAHHEQSLRETIELRAARVQQLQKLLEVGGAPGGELAESRVELAKARSDLAETGEKEAALAARGADAIARLQAARTSLSLLLATASSLAGRTVEELSAREGDRPAWQSIAVIERVAPFDGAVSRIHTVSGAQVEATASIMDLVDLSQVQVRAALLQSDAARLPSKPHARAIAPNGDMTSAIAGSGEASPTAPLLGSLIMAPTADAERRTIDVVLVPDGGAAVPVWAKPGVATMLEITLAGEDAAELAIPIRAVVRDGASALIFRRDPRDPDKAIRIDADLGIDDGRWIVVRSGLREGDEVVLDGAYQLMVATSASMPKGGHFHSDGTFHEGADDH